MTWRRARNPSRKGSTQRMSPSPANPKRKPSRHRCRPPSVEPGPPSPAPQLATASPPPNPAQLPAFEPVPAQLRLDTHQREKRIDTHPVEARWAAKARVATRDRQIERAEPPARAAMAPPASGAPQAKAAAAPSAGISSAPALSPAFWKVDLMVQLNRHKRFPPGAGAGTASVTFTINRTGEVLSARLTASSGDTALDAEAVSLPRRASPLPAPPAGIGTGGSVTIAVPIRFNR